MEILIIYILALLLNIIMFVPAFLLKTDKLTDISYAFTFFVLAIFGFSSSNIALGHLLLLLMIALWAIRIGLYLLIRIKKIGRDKRFDEMRSNLKKFMGFWLLQGFTVATVMITSTLFFFDTDTRLTGLSYFGILVFFLGLLIETFADLQKYKFINNPNNQGKWIGSGLWKYSRHPNYFGEILVWLGIYLFAVCSLSAWEILIGLISPLYIALLIIFVSGVPILERGANERWGNDPKYQEYKRKTSILLLLPNKK